MLAANEIKVDTNELVQILTLTRKEILELENPFGCGDSPLFTYPFFGEDQLINLSIPPGTPESVMESLEIVLCIDTTSSHEGKDCFLGVSDEKILREARQKIQEKLMEMFEAIGSEIKFHHSWIRFQQAITNNNKIFNSNDLFNPIDKDVFKLMKPGNRGALYDRLQVLLPFFIEAATPIDSSDPKWTIYLKTTETDGEEDSRRITGLLTTYSYFRFPEGLRVRISQVLIFPRDQKNRLGTLLYKSVTRSLRSDGECQEICVEDPTDGFERIRGLIDWQEADDLGIFDKENDDSVVIQKLTKELKLNSEHAERILNLNKSFLAEPTIKRAKTTTTNDSTTILRQTIKRWLLKKYKKDLPEDKVDRIAKLAELYESEMEEFIEPILEIIKT